MKSHPMQPLEKDDDGVIRFKQNKIVRFLQQQAAKRGLDMNALAELPFAQEDRIQLAQLLGYSVGGFTDLPYVPAKVSVKAYRTARDKFPSISRRAA